MRKKLFVFLMAFFMVTALCCGCASSTNNLGRSETPTTIEVGSDEQESNALEDEGDEKVHSMDAWHDHTEEVSISYSKCTISRPGQLAYIAKNDGKFKSVEIWLDADLDMSAYEWDDIFKEFKGEFSGRGHTIYGIRVEDNYFDITLFGKLNGATVTNLNVVGTYSIKKGTSYKHFGGIAAEAVNSTIENCTFDGKVTTSDDYYNRVGGIVGTMSGGNIRSCINYAEFSIGKAASVGGIAGYVENNGGISYSANFGVISKLNEWKNDFGTGGIVGYVKGKSKSERASVSGCVNYTSMATSASNNNIGGICGRVADNTYVSRCLNYGKIQASNAKDVGGIIGFLGKGKNNSVSKCVSYGEVSGNENVGSVVGEIHNNVISGCVGRGDGDRFGTWYDYPSDLYDDKYMKRVSNLKDYQTQAFLENYQFEFGEYDYWRFNTAAYNFLQSRGKTQDSSTKNNIKVSSVYGSAIPKELIGTMSIYIKYTKPGGVEDWIDSNDQYVKISSLRKSSSTDSVAVYGTKTIIYLRSAPYNQGASNSCMDIFKIEKCGNAKNGFVLDSEKTKQSWRNGSNLINITTDSKGAQYCYVRFKTLGDGKYRAPYGDFGANNGLGLYFTAQSQKVELKLGGSTETFDSFGANINGFKTNYYYRDALDAITVTPRLGYYLAAVYDSRENYFYGTSSSSETTLGVITLPAVSDWFRYDITELYFYFKPVVYNLEFWYTGTNSSLGSIEKTWNDNNTKAEICDDFINPVLELGYKYKFTGFSMKYGSSYTKKENFPSSDMDTKTTGSQSESALYVSDKQKTLFTQIGSLHSFKKLFGAGGSKDVTNSCLTSTTIRVYLQKDAALEYGVKLLKGYEIGKSIGGNTGASIKVSIQNDDGTDQTASFPGVERVSRLTADDTYKIEIGAYRGYEVTGYYIYAIVKNPNVALPSDVEKYLNEENGLNYSGEYNNSEIKKYAKYVSISNIMQRYAGDSSSSRVVKKMSDTDLFIKDFLTRAVQAQKGNKCNFNDSNIFSEAKLNQYFDFYIEAMYKPLNYTISFSYNDAGVDMENTSQSGLDDETVKSTFVSQDGTKNLSVEINSKNYLDADIYKEANVNQNKKKIELFYFDSVKISVPQTLGNKELLGIYCGGKLLTLKNEYKFIVDPYKFTSIGQVIESLTFNIKYSDAFTTETETTEKTATNHVYTISSADDLIWLSTQVAADNGFTGLGYIFNQTCDIDMSGTKIRPIGTEEHPFTGVYNGNGYRILNLKFDDENLSYVGLFGNVSGATIKNLTIDGGSFTGYAYVGAFAGKATNSKFENVHNHGCKLDTRAIRFYDVYGAQQNNAQSINYAISAGFEKNNTLHGDITGERWWEPDTSTCESTLYSVARNSTSQGIGGIVGYATGCKFLAVAVNADITNQDKTGEGNILGIVSLMVGYGSGNEIDQCYAKGEFSGISSVNKLYGGTADVSHVYIIEAATGEKTYSDNEEYRQNNPDIWMQINGEWVLKIFYW